MTMLTQITEKINTIFGEKYLEEIARETKFIARKRKIDPKMFLEKVLLLRLEFPNSSLEELAQEFFKNDVAISKQALHKKINKNTVEFVKRVLEKLQQEMFSEQQLYLGAIPFIKNVHAVDSSEIRLNKRLKDQFPQTRNQGAAIKLQTLMDAVSGQIKLLDIRPSKEPDQGYKEHLFHVEPNDLVITDLGYFSVESFTNIHLKGGYFLSRYFKNTHMYELTTEEQIDLRSVLSKAHQEGKEKMMLDIALGTSKFLCRLAAIRLPEDAYKKRLKGLEEKHRKDPRSKSNQYDVLNHWTIFVTNLPLSVEADILLRLYSLRWQIELLFKMMKTFLALRNIDAGNSYRASLSIYVSLIAMTLLSLVSATIVDKEISLYKAGKIFIKNIRNFFYLINKGKKCAVSWLANLLGKFALKESRKKRPSTKCLLETTYA